jgi:formylglycine-generating enzyme required for sulfatase activity
MDTSGKQLSLAVGTLVNQYVLLAELGQGGFGVVYKAKHSFLHEDVVVKEFLPMEFAWRQGNTVTPHGDTKAKLFDDFLERFLTEGRTLVKLRHPNVVRCRDLFTANGTAYLVMDFEDGLPLDSLVTSLEAQGGRYTELELLHFLMPLAEGLSYIHSQGVLHRDIKPANVFIRRKDGSPVIIDFGAAKQNFAKVSQSQAPYTEFYAPLEQIEGGGEAKATIDIYAFGALMYRLVTGQIGAKAESRAMALAFQKPDALTPAVELAKERYREEFLSLIDKCLAFDANQRPQQMSEVLGVLQQLNQSLHEGNSLRDSNPPPDSNSSAEFKAEAPKSAAVSSQVERNENPAASSSIGSVNDPAIKYSEASKQSAESQQSAEPQAPSKSKLPIALAIAAVLAVGGGYWLVQQQAEQQAQLEFEKQQALEKQQSIEKQQDEAAWQKAFTANTEAEYDAYLANHPNGLHREQANTKIAEIKAAQKQQAVDAKIAAYVGELVTIPAGSFMMGCSEGDSECSDDEKPQHRVNIQSFKLMSTEVTFAMWDACVSAGVCSYQPTDAGWGRGNRPVINVSYDDITQQFIPWLNQATGQRFRLPTEAEWEYAARAGSSTKYSWGNSIRCDQARFGQYDGDCGDARSTMPVKSFSANAFGLYDMHGNVWEWTQDCWNDNYQGAPLDGSAWQRGDCAERVLRGGSWISFAADLRASYRYSGAPDTRYYYYGFRVAQD